MVERTATEYYLVTFGSPSTAVAASAAVDVATHPDDSALKFKSKSAKMVDESNRLEWQVQVDFSNKRPEAEQEENPLNRPAEYSWSFDQSSQPYFIDVEDKPVVNTSGEPFEDLKEREISNITGSVKKNVPASYSAATLANYKRAINNGAFTFDGVSIGDGQARFAGADLSPVKSENGVSYREISVTFKFRETWDDEVEDRGFNELGAGNKLKEIVKGVPPTRVDKPYPLDGAGKAKPNPTDVPHKLTFKPYDRLPFNVFNF